MESYHVYWCLHQVKFIHRLWSLSRLMKCREAVEPVLGIWKEVIILKYSKVLLTPTHPSLHPNRIMTHRELSVLITLEYHEESESHTPGCSMSGPWFAWRWGVATLGAAALVGCPPRPTYLLKTSGLVSFSNDWRRPHGEKGWNCGIYWSNFSCYVCYIRGVKLVIGGVLEKSKESGLKAIINK